MKSRNDARRCDAQPFRAADSSPRIAKLRSDIAKDGAAAVETRTPAESRSLSPTGMNNVDCASVQSVAKDCNYATRCSLLASQRGPAARQEENSASLM